MKRYLISALAITALGLPAFPDTAAGQNQAAAEVLPHKVGLIDMGHVFQEYDKFKLLRDELKTEIEASDASAKQFLDQSQTLQAKIKEFKQDSQKYVEIEKQLLQVKSDFEAFRAGAQRDLMRRESQIYKSVYMEVADAVREYAKYYKYTLVIRFNRKNVGASEAPGDIVQGMNRQVVYFQDRDDITDKVLRYLNNNYRKQAARPAAAPRRTATRNK